MTTVTTTTITTELQMNEFHLDAVEFFDPIENTEFNANDENISSNSSSSNSCTNKNLKNNRLSSKQQLIKRKKAAPKKITGPPYVCGECEHESPSAKLLASHRHRKHRILEYATRKCPKCAKVFSCAQRLAQHLKRPNCEPYPEFKCEYCGKLTIGFANHKIHLRIHTKQYPFVCDLCGKHFMMSVHLTQHIKTKHEYQRFICEFENCGKMFQNVHSLKNHYYTHLGALPYKCDYCEHTFPSKGSLRFHIKSKHGIAHSLTELDGMMVSDTLKIKAELQPVAFKVAELIDEHQENCDDIQK